jgi:hypothetical protein
MSLTTLIIIMIRDIIMQRAGIKYLGHLARSPCKNSISRGMKVWGMIWLPCK